MRLWALVVTLLVPFPALAATQDFAAQLSVRFFREHCVAPVLQGKSVATELTAVAGKDGVWWIGDSLWLNRWVDDDGHGGCSIGPPRATLAPVSSLALDVLAKNFNTWEQDALASGDFRVGKPCGGEIDPKFDVFRILDSTTMNGQGNYFSVLFWVRSELGVFDLVTVEVGPKSRSCEVRS